MEGYRGRRAPVLRVYVAAVFAAGIATIWLTGQRWGAPAIGVVVLFWSMHAAADATAIRLPQGSLSAGFLVLMTVAIGTDPATAAAVGLTSALSIVDWRRGDPLRAVFNAGQGALYTGASSAVFHIASAGAEPGPLTMLAATALAAAVAFALNTGFVAAAIALERGRELLSVWRLLLWPAPAYLGFAVVALLVAVLYRAEGAVAAILLVTPMVALRLVHHAFVELDRAHESTLRAFVRVVELKDPYTRGHSERVAEIAAAMFAALGAKGDELRSRYRGALLHDLGKVGVSGRILGKPGRLTSEEFEAVKAHPSIGASTAERIGFLRDEVGQIRHHHERLDGGGYPDGLLGAQIPFAARVLSVADAFESMAYPRPYRGAMPVPEVLAEIERATGTQFDPVPAKLIADLVCEGRVSVPRFPRADSPAATAEDTSLDRRRA